MYLSCKDVKVTNDDNKYEHYLDKETVSCRTCQRLKTWLPMLPRWWWKKECYFLALLPTTFPLDHHPHRSIEILRVAGLRIFHCLVCHFTNSTFLALVSLSQVSQKNLQIFTEHFSILEILFCIRWKG